jgi:hypothetical protein
LIPDFDVRGYLPPGIHPATVEEIEVRFGQAQGHRRGNAMRLTNPQGVRTTQEKITRLEAAYQEAKLRDMGNPQAKELVLMGLRRTINRMKEDIMRFERDVRSERSEVAPAISGTR